MKHAKIIEHFFILGLATIVSGCQFDPIAGEYTTSKPQNADLIGTYVLTSESMTGTAPSLLKSQKGLAPGNYKIILKSDGTFKYINMPVWVGDWANGVDEWIIKDFKTGSGRWRVNTSGSVGSDPIWGLDISVPADRVAFTGDKAPHSIVMGYGDPDGGDAMTYERQDVAKTQ